MKLGKIITAAAVFAATVGLCLPQPLLAARPVDRSPTVVDVTLLADGVLIGQVVDTSGLPDSAVPVAIHSGARQLAVGRTDGNGYFAFRGLRGGVYQIHASEGCGAYRVWTAGTAPPHARQGALIVAGQDLIRGGPVGDALGWTGFFIASKPLLVAALVATAIAVPLAIHDADKDKGSKPISP